MKFKILIINLLFFMFGVKTSFSVLSISVPKIVSISV